MNKNTSVIMASVVVTVLAVGIVATSVTQSVLAARNVGWGTDGDSGGNGGAGQTGGTAHSGPATGESNTGADTANTGSDAMMGPVIINVESNAVGCGHIGGSGSSGNKC